MVAISRKDLHDACLCAIRRIAADEDFTTEHKGEQGTLDYRVFFRNSEGQQVSPWHSVPLYADHGLVHYVCEIPRNTRAKYEVSLGQLGNPIKQDSKKGKPRFYGLDMTWNYGMFPQTWEDPSHPNEDCGGYVGDSDPVDVVDIGDHTAVTGGFYRVKPICALAMIDEGELDWKVLAIPESDPRCHLVNDVADLEVHFPGTVHAVREWFRTYKTYEGKPLNQFELNEQAVGREYTMDILRQTHGFWKSLIQRVYRAEHGAQLLPCDKNVAVGEVPINTGCFEPEDEEGREGSGAITEAVNSVLESVHGHEAEIIEALGGNPENFREQSHRVCGEACKGVRKEKVVVEEEEHEANRRELFVEA